MKLTEEQAERIRIELLLHVDMSNSDANACYDRYVHQRTRYASWSVADTFNDLLEEHNSFLTDLVNKMVYDRIKP